MTARDDKRESLEQMDRRHSAERRETAQEHITARYVRLERQYVELQEAVFARSHAPRSDEAFAYYDSIGMRFHRPGEITEEQRGRYMPLYFATSARRQITCGRAEECGPDEVCWCRSGR